MSEPVSFLTIEDLDDGIDLVVSFGIGPYAEKSLTLLRTPTYEALLPAEERGVSVGYGVDDGPEREMLVSLHWGAKDVRITSSRREWVLDVQAIDPQDCACAKKVLREMNFDARFRANGIEAEPGPGGVELSYDPNRAPAAQQWLDLAEADRIRLVEGYHRRAHIKVPGMTAHCAIHAIVENQLAMKLDFVGAALERLMKQGLTRHDAVHAIGSQIADIFVDAARDHSAEDGQATNARYKASIERLSAASWRRLAKCAGGRATKFTRRTHTGQQNLGSSSSLLNPRRSDLVQRTAHAPPTAVEHVGVDHRGRHITVAEQFLHRSDVVSRLHVRPPRHR